MQVVPAGAPELPVQVSGVGPVLVTIVQLPGPGTPSLAPKWPHVPLPGAHPAPVSDAGKVSRQLSTQGG